MRPGSKKIIAVAVLAVATWTFLSGEAKAVGLAVAPSEVSISGRAGEPAMASIRITNTSNSVALFEAYPDDLRSIVAISPASFTLQGGESREIVVTMNAPAGKFETMISVVVTPLSSDGFMAGAGIKVPLRAVFESEAGLLANISGILGAGALPIGLGVAALALFLRFFKISPRRREE